MKIFVAGAVSTAKEEQIEKYQIYKNCVHRCFGNVYLTTPDVIWEYRNKCVNENPNADKTKIDTLMVDYDLKQVAESDLIACDLSELSTGMGIELGVAYEHKKNIIFFYQKGSYISNMIIGAFPNSQFIEYESNAELENKLKDALKNICNLLPK